MSVGESCEKLRNESDKKRVREIVEIEYKQTRLNQFKEVYK